MTTETKGLAGYDIFLSSPLKIFCDIQVTYSILYITLFRDKQFIIPFHNFIVKGSCNDENCVFSPQYISLSF